MRLFLPLLLTLPTLAQTWPGDPLPADFPQLRSEATVTATAIADDKSVFILGDFDQVDGIPGPRKVQSDRDIKS